MPGFACHECGYVFPQGITMGVVAAHFETEHGDAEVALDLLTGEDDGRD
jgi:hypothetical protein